jgi:hypothetical protein
MSQQHQQQIEEDEDHSTISAEEFVRLNRTPANRSRIGDFNGQQQEGSDEANGKNADEQTEGLSLADK